MPTIIFNPDAYDAQVQLLAADPDTARKVDDVIDDIEEDASKPYLRRIYLQSAHLPSGGVYKVAIVTPAGHPDFMVLWDDYKDQITIQYVGPDFEGLGP